MLDFTAIACVYAIIAKYRVYKRAGVSLLSNYNFLLLFGALFYVYLPNLIFDITKINSVQANLNSLAEVKYMSSQVLLVFLIFFVFSKCHLSIQNLRNAKILNLNLIKISLILATIFISILIFTNIGVDIFSMSRVDKYNIFISISRMPGFTLLSWFLFIWTYILIFSTNNLRWILFMLPLLMMDILLSSRLYIFFTGAIVVTHAIGAPKKFNFELIAFIVFIALLCLGFIREADDKDTDTYSLLIKFSGEIINTWWSTFFVIDNNINSLYSPMEVVITKTIPNILIDLMFGNFQIYTDKISDVTTLDFGIGSSILAEMYAYGIGIFHPIFLGLIAYCISNIRNIGIYGGTLKLMFLVTVYAIFRGGFYNNLGSNIMVYCVIFLLPMVVFRKKL